MSVCIPKHIICDTFTPDYTPGGGSSSLPTIQTAKRARSVSGGSNSPVGGVVWRSIGLGPLANNISIDIIWENIRRFNGFAFGNPPSPTTANTSNQYAEIDVRVKIYISGQLFEDYFDVGGSPLFTQSVTWIGIDTNDDTILDTTQLCWTCERDMDSDGNSEVFDTSNVTQTLRNHINSNSEWITVPSTDVQTSIQISDGSGGTTTQTWSSSYDQDHLGLSNSEIATNASNLDNAASNNNSYTTNSFSLEGASLPTPSGGTGPFYALILAFDSEAGNSDGSITTDANELRYWGQETLPTCYDMTWLPFDNENDPDCGMSIIGFKNQNTFVIDDLVQSELSPGDTFVVYGPQIDDATNASPAQFSSYRMNFEVQSADEPGNGTTEIVITQTLPSLHSNYNAVGTVCRASECQ